MSWWVLLLLGWSVAATLQLVLYVVQARTGSATVVDAGATCPRRGHGDDRLRSADDPRPSACAERGGPALPGAARAMAGTRRGVIAALLSLPLLAAVYNRHDGLEALEWIGVAVWLAGLVCEVQADRQLERFRRAPSNPGGRDRQGAVALLPAPELLRPVADVVRLRARRPRGAVGLGRATVARAQPPPDPLRHRCAPARTADARLERRGAPPLPAQDQHVRPPAAR